MSESPPTLRYRIEEAIEKYVEANPDISLWQPDDVKMLSRHIRDRLLEQFDVIEKAVAR